MEDTQSIINCSGMPPCARDADGNMINIQVQKNKEVGFSVVFNSRPWGKELVQAWNKSLEINDKSDRGVNVL